MKLKRILLGLPVALAIFILTISARPSKDITSSYYLCVGDAMPTMNTQDKVLQDLVPKANSKRYTLIHFWASYDAESRAKNIEYNSYFARTISDKITYRDISLDPDEDVYRITLQIDAIDTNSSNCVASLREKVIDLYRLEKQLSTFLVDDKGRICAVNPTKDELKKFYLI